MISSVDSNYATSYVYGQDGQRSNKYTHSSETLYFNKMWTLHTDSGNSVYGGQYAKNIYLGEARIVTKLNSGKEPTYHEDYYKQYFYHSDHLGSASLISDYKGDEYQRIEYTPYGETWVEKTQNQGLEYLPYKFTAKELDEETGLYYYGARYMNPKYSRWLSTDPALGEYMAGSQAGMGVAYNSVNLNLYHYGNNNPVKYTDPDGRVAFAIPIAVIAAKALVATVCTYIAYQSLKNTGKLILDAIEDGQLSAPSFAKENSKPEAKPNDERSPMPDAGAKSGESDSVPKEGAESGKKDDGLGQVLDGAKPGRDTKGHTKQWGKPGTMDDANGDFDSLNPSNVKNIPGGRTGELPDGRRINVRDHSSDGRPTLEVQNGKNRIKVRYGEGD